jgi:hypothetical protein
VLTGGATVAVTAGTAPASVDAGEPLVGRRTTTTTGASVEVTWDAGWA